MNKLPLSFDIQISFNISFIGNENGTIFDYNNKLNGSFIFTFFQNQGELLKFENITIKNYPYNNNNIIDIIVKSDNFFIFFNHCYFSKIEKSLSNNNYGALYYSESGNEYMYIKDSIFENINIESSVPLIYNKGLQLLMENTTFINCYSNYGYLFESNNKRNIVTILDSTFINTYTLFNGESSSYNINNSVFKNVKLNNSIPAIANVKQSIFEIYNSEFSDMTLDNGLFNKESLYKFTNITVKNIDSNSKALFSFLNNNINFNNVIIENVKCFGDEENSSLLLFDSGENEKKIYINNLNINNCISNGSFIIIKGDSSIFTLKNSNINNVLSYGSIINNESKKIKFMVLNSNFKDNTNSNKYRCGGIHINNNLNVTISNSTFINNVSKGHGGAFCVTDILDIELNIVSNTFENNKSIDGGALYIIDKAINILNKNNNNNNNDNNNNDNNNDGDMIVTIKDNKFIKNYAQRFGGGLYINFYSVISPNIKDNHINSNKAGALGGGIYIPKLNNNKYLLHPQNEIINNTVNTLDSNVATKPTYITLETKLNNNLINITTGNIYPLEFKLKDEFGNLIEDISNYYSSLSLTLNLKDINDNKGDSNFNDTNNNDKTFELYGNVCSFIKGQCKLNNFQVFGEFNTYKLVTTVKNYNEYIDLKFDEINITINECNSYQIKMKNPKTKVLYCETPICPDTCSNETAICLPKYREFINDINENICECLPGWEGENCQNRIIFNYRTLNIILKLLVTTISIIVLYYMVFITAKRKHGIINDIGYLKIFTFSAGILIFFISILYSTYTSFLECSLNFSFKHTGLSLIILIFLKISYINLELSTKKTNKENNYYYFNSPDLKDEEEDLEITTQYNNDLILETTDDKKPYKSYLNSVRVKGNLIKYSENVNNNRISNQSSHTGEINENVLKKIEKTNKFSRIVSFCFTFHILTIITMAFVKLYINMKDGSMDKFLQDDNKIWFYNCNLQHADLVYSMVEMFFFIIILLNGNKLAVRNNRFKCIRYITLSVLISIFLGPIINVFSYMFFNNQRKTKIIFEVLLNTICYLTVFILFSWDKVYYILKNQGDDPTIYFIYEKHELCTIHQSTSCGCKLNISKDILLVKITQSINYYTLCSSIVYKVFPLKNLLNNWNKTFYSIICIIIWGNNFLKLINATNVTVNNEKELLNNLIDTNNNSTDILVINLIDQIYQIPKDIEIESSIEKIHIIGHSRNSSVIKFNDSSNQFNFKNFVYNSKQEIKFVNVTIEGNLQFYGIANIVFEDDIINGTIDIDKTFKYDVEYKSDENYQDKDENYLKISVTMTKVIYNGLTNSKYNCINLHGKVKIKSSYFFGNSLCENSLLHYDGENHNSIEISNSNFNGMYENNCLSMIDGISSTVKTSTFENCSGFLDGGAALRTNRIPLKLKDCIFRNIYTPYYGGVFYIVDPSYMEIEKIKVYNSTALDNGSILNVLSNLDNLLTLYMKNVKYYGNRVSNSQSSNFGSDSISSVTGYIHLNMEDFYGEDLFVNNIHGIFMIDADASISIKNIEINRVYGEKSSGLLFYNNYSEGTNGQYFEITHGSFKDFIFNQVTESLSAIIGTNNIMNITLSDCKFINFDVYKSNFIYNSQENNIIMNNVTIDGYHSSQKVNFIESSGYHDSFSLKLIDVSIKNFSSIGKFIYCFTLDLVIENSTITNNMKCSSLQCDDIYYIDSLIDFYSYYVTSNIYIKESTFDTIKGVSNSDDYIINFNNCTFENNRANNLGGIVYSHRHFPEDYTPQYNDFYFNNCIFKNNTASQGDISFSYLRSHEVIFSNIDELIQIKGAIVTNPIGLRLTTDSIIEIFDEYNNKFNTEQYKSINDMVLFELQLNETFNGKIIGSSVYNCDVGTCSIPLVKGIKQQL
ncbi:hypothetical protein BCR32DRAFT_273116 [Anaeromyces robustus]|uniref:EGF-like domain-containing protein n=1 Tax=Anaeromyces robustus TaxID=1754192 RepID=A0A1Y1VTT5_9FUNG|nr:hypothetical protein BCR32DRAFT_273116 [Anaeromyces robustus]|eukprot:ORX64425.1 hypothetical protein BCR32DRAFT_273116 [Anaeromyces robustus]